MFTAELRPTSPLRETRYIAKERRQARTLLIKGTRTCFYLEIVYYISESLLFTPCSSECAKYREATCRSCLVNIQLCVPVIQSIHQTSSHASNMFMNKTYVRPRLQFTDIKGISSTLFRTMYLFREMFTRARFRRKNPLARRRKPPWLHPSDADREVGERTTSFAPGARPAD